MANTGGSRYRVLYDYDATIPDELTIRNGQIVYVTEELDKGWVRGYIGDQSGMFPAGYVEPDNASSGPPSTTLPSVPSTSKPTGIIEGAASNIETAQVIEDFQSKETSQLPLKKDELVIIFRKFPTGWASGESGGRTGMFPLKNVRMLDFNEAVSLRGTSTTPSLTAASTSKKTSTKEKRISRVRASTLSSTTRVRKLNTKTLGETTMILHSLIVPLNLNYCEDFNGNAIKMQNTYITFSLQLILVVQN